MDPPQNQLPGSSNSSERIAGINSNTVSNNGGDGTVRRSPKVDVYIPPRQRRGANDDTSNLLVSESTDSRQNSTALSPRQTSGAPRNTMTTTRSNSSYGRDDGYDDASSSSRSGNNSSSSDVQRRRKFMSPGTTGGNGGGSGGASKTNGGNGGVRGRDYRGSGSSGNGSSRNSNNKNSGYHSGSASTSSPSSQQPSPTTQTPPAPRHTPRGPGFDATVLRRYSDDENRPNSSFSRSSSYTSTRSNNNQSSSTSTYSRSAGRTQESNSAASRRPDRSDEGPWRRELPKSTEATTTPPTGGSGTTDSRDQESDLAAQLESVRLSTSASASRSGSPDDTESTDEPEEWELALQNSDDDAIPAAPKDTRRHPAEHLLTSSSSTPSKIGNWSEGMHRSVLRSLS